MTEKNKAIDTPVSNVDVFPTLLKMLNIEIPPDISPQGKDITNLLTGEIPGSSEPVFAQYNMENFGIAHLRMVRFENWKLVKRFNQAAPSELIDELYDLELDPSEENNLIDQSDYQAIKKKLEDMLYLWQVKINDPVLSENS